jgi:hypothetical protein
MVCIAGWELERPGGYLNRAKITVMKAPDTGAADHTLADRGVVEAPPPSEPIPPRSGWLGMGRCIRSLVDGGEEPSRSGVKETR